MSAKGSPGLIVPNIITEDPFELLPSEHKVLAMLKDTSEVNTDSLLALIDDDFESESFSRPSRRTKRQSKKQKQFRTTIGAYNDHRLGGGGVQSMRELLVNHLHYCTNPLKTNGKIHCQILLPDGHTGRCPRCQYACSDCSVSGEKFRSEDIVIRLEFHYPIVANQNNSHLLQHICDYHNIAMKRISQHPEDEDARVYCTLSGLTARRDYVKNPKHFELDVEAAVNDTALVNGRRVKVIEKYSQTYVVQTPQGKRLEVEKEKVEKIGGHFPLDVVVFDDGAEVYNALKLPYSNDGKTEQIFNIPEEYRDCPTFCAWLGTTCGGKVWPNTRQRQVSLW